jgi:hypothetical protein
VLYTPRPTPAEKSSCAADQSSGAAEKSSGAAEKSSGAADQSSGAADQSSGAADHWSGAAEKSSGAPGKSFNGGGVVCRGEVVEDGGRDLVCCFKGASSMISARCSCRWAGPAEVRTKEAGYNQNVSPVPLNWQGGTLLIARDRYTFPLPLTWTQLCVSGQS